MKWELVKTAAIKLAPVALGMLIGVGGTNAVTTTKPTAQVEHKVSVTCITPKPDPIKVEFIRK